MAVDSTRLPYLSTSFQLDYFNIQSLKYVSIFEWNIWNFTSLTCFYFIFVAKAYRRFITTSNKVVVVLGITFFYYVTFPQLLTFSTELHHFVIQSCVSAHNH